MGVESERVKGFEKLEDGLRQASDWYVWAPMWVSGTGGRCGRITVPPGRPGTICLTIMPGPRPTDGVRTACSRRSPLLRGHHRLR